MKGSADSEGALDVDLSGMFLNDAVADRKTEARAATLSWFRRRFSSEKWIVNTLEMLGGDSRTGVCNHGFDVTVGAAGAARSSFGGGMHWSDLQLCEFFAPSFSRSATVSA